MTPSLGCRLSLATITALLAAAPARGQLAPLPHQEGAVGLGLALRRLPVSASVLYVTAHPDDENNGVLVHLGHGRGYDTSLLTVTRGDGGQNEIGAELFQALGILRTEELAGIHRYDGAAQYFTRAYEFGYSFSVEETFEKWGREEILADVVRVIRKVRPDVILTLPLEGAGGGQHHQAAGRLAVEAFRAAADPARFPEQIAEGLPAWQARKVYRGGVGGGNEIPKDLPSVSVDTSAYDPLLGQSAHQFGILARAMHKCQGMTQMRAPPGTGAGVFVLVDSEPRVSVAETDIFEGIDTSLAGLTRLAGGGAGSIAPGLQAMAEAARQAQEAYDARAPERTTVALRAGLIAVRRAIGVVGSGALDEAARHELRHRLAAKERDFQAALGLAHGLTLEASVDDGDVVPGQPFKVRVRAFNQGGEPVRLMDLALAAPEGWTVSRQGAVPETLASDGGVEVGFTITVGPKARYTQPYWRRDPAVDRYAIDIPEHHTLPWSPPEVTATLKYGTGEVAASLTRPAWWPYEGRWVGGEKQKVLNVVPALSVAVTPEIAVVPVGGATRREFRVHVLHNGKGAAEAVARLKVPAGWTVEPREAPLPFRLEGEEGAARFFVSAPSSVQPGSFEVTAEVELAGQVFREGYQVIAYDHIQERHLFRPAAAKIQAIPVRTASGVTIGYIEGAGDEVAEAIEQLGVAVTPIGPDELAWGDLSRFSTIVTGIRAYQTRPDLRANNHRLLDFARRGGHVVVQYNKFEFNAQADPPGTAFPAPARPALSPYAPYPAAVTGNRITLEDAPVRVLRPEHPILRGPNAIAASDFEGWVQERGLYFLDARDPQYVELLAATDPFPKNPGEKKGMLVDAPVGKGSWTYVGLGLWRQLPAGTPGAYRLLANLLSRPRAR